MPEQKQSTARTLMVLASMYAARGLNAAMMKDEYYFADSDVSTMSDLNTALGAVLSDHATEIDGAELLYEFCEDTLGAHLVAEAEQEGRVAGDGGVQFDITADGLQRIFNQWLLVGHGGEDELAEVEPAVCVGCKCDDMHACIDDQTKSPCSWLRLDRQAKLGVCSSCPEHIERWDQGERTADATCGAPVPPEAKATVHKGPHLKLVTVAELHAQLQGLIDDGKQKLPVCASDGCARYPFDSFTVLNQAGHTDALLIQIRPDARFAQPDPMPLGGPGRVADWNAAADAIKQRSQAGT